MYDKKTIFRLFVLLLVICSLINSVSAQENKTEVIIQKENGTISQNANFSESPEKIQGDILIEAQKNFDWSLYILGFAVGIMGILVGLIAFIFVIGSVFGYSEYKAWKEIRMKCENLTVEAKDKVNIIDKIKEDAEKGLTTIRKIILGKKITLGNEKIEKLNIDDIKSERLSKEDIQELEDFHLKFELSKFFGYQQLSEDYYINGLYFFNKGLPELTLKELEKAIELKSDNGKAWTDKGVILVRLDRNNEAIDIYDELLDKNPQNAKVLYYKGIPLHKRGEYDEAIKNFAKAIELKTDKIADAYYNIACAYSLKGDKENALSNLKEAISKDASNKKTAQRDKDFKKFWNDKDFIELVGSSVNTNYRRMFNRHN